MRSAPGTYVWLAVLFVTTVALHHMSPVAEERFLRARSTNLRELSSHPVRVLIASAMWIEGGHWVPYAVLYSVFPRARGAVAGDGAVAGGVRAGACGGDAGQ
ncbi:hypothetical protein GCM10020256_42180 [Streptomyces thermocoprophilus]